MKQEKMESMKKFKKAQSMKKAMKALISIPILSLFLSSLPSCLPFFLSCNNRVVIFLVCNAILLFLVKNSGSVTGICSPSDCSYGELLNWRGSHEEDDIVVNGVVDDEKEEWSGDVSVGCLEVVVVEDDVVVVEEYDEGDGFMEIEELNKKFDEFIERFKTERRLEALQLIVV